MRVKMMQKVKIAGSRVGVLIGKPVPIAFLGPLTWKKGLWKKSCHFAFF